MRKYVSQREALLAVPVTAMVDSSEESDLFAEDDVKIVLIGTSYSATYHFYTVVADK